MQFGGGEAKLFIWEGREKRTWGLSETERMNRTKTFEPKGGQSEVKYLDKGEVKIGLGSSTVFISQRKED